MSPSGVMNAIPTIDSSGQTSAPALAPVDSPAASAMDAFSSTAGVTVRLLASLPANLGQNVDVAG